MANARLLLPPRYELIEVNLTVAARVQHGLETKKSAKHTRNSSLHPRATHDARVCDHTTITRGTLQRTTAMPVYERSKGVGWREGADGP